MNVVIRIFFIILFSFSVFNVFTQSYNDGPILLDVKLREVQGNFAATDESLLGIGFAPDELVFKIWAQDNLLTYPWTGGACLQDFNFTPIVGGGNSIDFNTTFASFSFPNTIVPQYLDFKIDAWEDDLPSDNLIGFCNSGTQCSWEDQECCGIFIFGFCAGITTGDDYRCDADPFYQGLSYRNGPPCQWYSHGYIDGTGCVNPSSQSGAPNTDGYYKPHIETYWRYTKGTSFANSIDLGSLTSGSTLMHFNSNECYNNNYSLSFGNDVFYSFNVNSSTGVNISLCGMNGAQFDSYLYLIQDTNVIAISENDNFCGNQSELTTALCDPGTYYIVVDAINALEMGTFTLTITEDPGSSFSYSSLVEDVSCNGGDDGKIAVSVNGGITPYTYKWFDIGMNLLSQTSATNQIEDSLSNLSAGTYIIEIVDNNNCSIMDTISIVEPSSISFISTLTSPSCYGSVDGQIDVSVTGGTPPYSYLWNTSPLQTGQSAVALSSGTYVLNVVDNNNCIDTLQEILLDPPAVPVSIVSSSSTVCAGGSINLQATGAINYVWSPSIWLDSTTSSSVVSTPNSSIVYTVTGTDVNGCSNTDTISLLVVQSLMMNSSPSSPSVCQGQGVSLTVTGGSSYLWIPSSGLNISTGSTVIASPQLTTSYMVIGTDNFGCSDTIDVIVDVLGTPNLNLTNNPSICEGESVYLTVNGANTYSWFPSNGLNNIIGSTVSADPLVSTVYSVIGTLQNGCADTVSTSVSVNPNPNVNIFPTSTSICQGDTALLFASGATNYIWSPSSAINSLNIDTVKVFPVSTMMYNVLGIDSLGCFSSDSILVNVYDLPIIDVSSSIPYVCLGDNILLTASGGDQYSWSPYNSLSSSVGDVVSASPLVNTVYMVVGTDINSCSSWDTVSISVNPLPILSISSVNSVICEGDSVTLSVSGADTYLWSPSLGLSSSLSNSVIASPDITTNYFVTGTDINGCVNLISSEVIVNPSPNLSTNPSSGSICEGATLEIEVFGADTYLWSPAFGLNTVNSNVVQASPSSSVSYTIKGVDANNCVDSIAFNLVVGVSPNVEISPNNPVICEGESVTLTASGAYTYSWSPSIGLSSSLGSSVVATPFETTLYSVIGEDILSCTDTNVITVSVIPLPTANISPLSGGTICSGDSSLIIIDLTGNPDWSVNYSINGTASSPIVSSSNPLIIYSDVQGVYTIPYIIDANGCTNSGSGSAQIDILNTPEAFIDFLPKDVNILDPEVTFINNTLYANNYMWYFGDNTSYSFDFDPIHIYEEEGTYQVTLVANNDFCTDTSKITVTIDPYYALYVPDVFTPNSDGLNDIFKAEGTSINSFEMFIYNRWGQEVFYSEDIDYGWDGGKGISGSYSYLILVVDNLGEFHRITGSVLLE